MMTKISGGGSGSSGGLVEYLEKEQQGHWFSLNREQLPGQQVVAELDANKRNLGREDDKYYQVILAPSQAELAHIGNSPQRLQEFTRAAMEEYAQNFGKGIDSRDLVWFAKLEHGRSFDYHDRAVQLGEQARGVAKSGDQRHVHVIVSRTENLRQYSEGKAQGQHERKNPYHLSPMTNHKATTKGVVMGGFERNGFSQRTEQCFDQRFGYERGLTESFRYCHGMRYGDEPTREGLQQELSQEVAAADRQKRAQSHEVGQGEQVHLHLTKSPQNEQIEDLRQGLSQAYRQKDFDELGAALQVAQAERERQRQVQEKLAAEAQKLAQEESKRVEQQKLQQKPEIAPEREQTPRQSRGLHL